VNLELTDTLRELDVDPLKLFLEEYDMYDVLEKRGVKDGVIVSVIDELEESLGFDENDASVEYDADELTDVDIEGEPEYDADKESAVDIDGIFEIVVVIVGVYVFVEVFLTKVSVVVCVDVELTLRVFSGVLVIFALVLSDGKLVDVFEIRLLTDSVLVISEDNVIIDVPEVEAEALLVFELDVEPDRVPDGVVVFDFSGLTEVVIDTLGLLEERGDCVPVRLGVIIAERLIYPDGEPVGESDTEGVKLAVGSGVAVSEIRELDD